MTEEWRSVVGWEGIYEASSEGRVRSVDRVIIQDGRFGIYKRLMPGRILRASHCTNGYLFVVLSRQTAKPKPYLVHRLVAFAFLGAPAAGMEVCHSNGIRTDNRVLNLRWDTRSENHADKVAHGTDARGEKNGMHKLTAKDVLQIRQSTERLATLAKMYSISSSTVCNIKKGKAWRHIGLPLVNEV